ncbi:hypothetical protein DL763_010245 [Monosporascus cannonballus]|nr:hypothetical protein DL763_010245 [Monosporascus cannonballus]
MASNPPGKCCIVGVKHEGEPTGQDVRVSQWDAYLATPPSTAIAQHADAGILYIPDVIGIWQNSRLVADQFATNGYATLIIDVFNGDPVPLNRPGEFDLFAWLTRGRACGT